ncbi:MAG: UDP-N-acetylmuramoyl-L-alanine--D-glutamate ligase [Treponema sp.]|jgi:UDP-N-acetylmuramoylalanine--D-glutamate ligase|nr:UDP-N-acetylmuramoyl-L-alanine--D-glutamate ligase [Treponema sp.]
MSKAKKNDQEKFAGMKVLIMGLGLHGGGLESARYLAERGAELTVTDLSDEKTLAPSIEKLEAGNKYRIRYVLGRHEEADFKNADMVIKNPGVRSDSSYLRLARRIETDISLFLAENPARILAVTGSKGKSVSASALYWVLLAARQEGKLPGKAWLGGNITVSPLSFLNELKSEDDVVLELSSWQLGDLRDRPLLKPRAALITAIMRDHQDRYDSMESYVADKRLVYRKQDDSCVTVAWDDIWGRSFLAETPGRSLLCAEHPLPETCAGGWITGPKEAGYARLWEKNGRTMSVFGELRPVVPETLLIPGYHQKKNLLSAAVVLLDLGLDSDFILSNLGAFPGVGHRLEFFQESGGVRYYNDSASTVPEAAAAALESFDCRIALVAGGADKNLDFSPLVKAASDMRDRLAPVILLAGSGSEKLRPLLEAAGLKYRGPFDDVNTAARAAADEAYSGDAVILSPGCASFGMFLNEFDRGNKWKEAVARIGC